MPGEFITIVSGLPRSGTSLMMQMLQAGGMQLLTDGVRIADEHNPRGYFEHEGVKHSRNDISWLESAGGKAVKVIHLLLTNLPAGREYRVVFMLRNIGEVINSQRTMLTKQGRPTATLSDEKLAEAFEKQLVTIRLWLAERPNFRVLYLEHREVIDHPAIAAGKVRDFVGPELDAGRMAGVVEAGLHRQRKSG